MCMKRISSNAKSAEIWVKVDIDPKFILMLSKSKAYAFHDAQLRRIQVYWAVLNSGRFALSISRAPQELGFRSPQKRAENLCESLGLDPREL